VQEWISGDECKSGVSSNFRNVYIIKKVPPWGLVKEAPKVIVNVM